MLKLTLKPGEFIRIGENIKVVFSGGSANNIHLLVDAPREIDIARSSARKSRTSASGDDAEDASFSREVPYSREKGISPEAQQAIREILMREKYGSKNKKQVITRD